MAYDKSGYPTDVSGAVMKDAKGNECFVSTEHVKHAVEDRLALGWTIVDDRRPAAEIPKRVAPVELAEAFKVAKEAAIAHARAADHASEHAADLELRLAAAQASLADAPPAKSE